MLIILRQSIKHANFWLGVQYPQGKVRGKKEKEGLGTTSKPIRWFRPVSVFLNNDNRLELERTAGQLAVGF